MPKPVTHQYQCPLCEALHLERYSGCCDGHPDPVTVTRCYLGMSYDHHFGHHVHIVEGHQPAKTQAPA